MEITEQLADELIEKIKEINCNTDFADRERAEEIIRSVYDMNDTDSPEIIWCDSPFGIIESKIQFQLCVEIGTTFDDCTTDEAINEIFESNLCSNDALCATFIEYGDDLSWGWQLARCCEMAVAYEEPSVAFLCERPEYVAIDEDGLSHNEFGPAIRYRDGYERFFWHGVEVPKKVILEPEGLTEEDFTNASERVYEIMLERRK